MTISMVMIARDEAANIDRCFESFWDHVDQVVLVDTGSKDGTLAKARAFAKRKHQPDKLVTGRFKWVDDFAAARNHAESLATGDWHTWCDLDDTIQGADKLREIAGQQPDHVDAVFFRYRYGTDEHDNAVCLLWRERLVRAGKGEWRGRVHESQIITTAASQVAPELCEWVHHRVHDTVSRRNVDILEQWGKDEPDNPRVLSYLGAERGAHGEHAGVIDAFTRYLEIPGEPPDQRAQNTRKLANALIATERVREAQQITLEAVGENPLWPDSYLTLAEICANRQEWPKAIHWAQRILDLGVPDTLLIVNPLEYTIVPLSLIAGAHAGMGDFDQAIKYAEKALETIPGHLPLVGAVKDWAMRAQRENAAKTWIACAEMLVRHDEQQRALTLLSETPPWFIRSHPAVVARLSELRQKLAWVTDGYDAYYQAGTDKPEMLHQDDSIIQAAGLLPRAQFLLAGLS